MKTLLASAGIFMLLQHELPAVNIDRVIDTLELIESGGDVEAIGDSGKAVGVLQIWPIMVDEANRLSPYQFSYDDRYSRKKSRLIAKIFFVHQIRLYYKKFRRLPSEYELVSSWNTGSILKKINKRYVNKYRSLK